MPPFRAAPLVLMLGWLGDSQGLPSGDAGRQGPRTKSSSFRSSTSPVLAFASAIALVFSGRERAGVGPRQPALPLATTDILPILVSDGDASARRSMLFDPQNGRRLSDNRQDSDHHQCFHLLSFVRYTVFGPGLAIRSDGYGYLRASRR